MGQLFIQLQPLHFQHASPPSRCTPRTKLTPCTKLTPSHQADPLHKACSCTCVRGETTHEKKMWVHLQAIRTFVSM